MRCGYAALLLAALAVLLSACTQQPMPDEDPLDACQRMNDTVERDWCFLGAAVAQNDSAVCGYVADEKLREDCYGEVALNN